MHTSPRRAESYLPVFAGLYAENPEYFESNYGIDEKEAEMLGKFAPRVRKSGPKQKEKSKPKPPEKPAQEKAPEKEPEAEREKEGEESRKKLPKPTKVEHVGPKLHEFF
jgi:hypothetical protein